MAEEAFYIWWNTENSALWGHTETTMLTSPLKASDRAADKHSVQVHYLCSDLGREADNICE